MKPGRLLSSTTRAGAKPKVLLVDDHPWVLQSVSATLADDFDVAGMAFDGQQAIEQSSRIDPDIVVVDIMMPGLDGFQTVRALERNGSRAKVVFLSTLDAPEFVAEAFACGGSGYVVKGRAHADLPGALAQVLDGRQFVPSLKALFQLTSGRAGHAMHIRGDSNAYIDGVADFFDLALRNGDATALIGDEPVREAIAARLRKRGWSTTGPDAHPRYVASDLAESLARFMRNGRPDVGLLAVIAAELEEYRLTLPEGPARRVVIFGSMADQLMADGNGEAAIALERAWSDLTRELPFFTVCSYSSERFEEAASSPLFSDACCAHAAVTHANIF